MQSRRRRKKVVAGRCGIKFEATLASPVFGQTRSIEIAVDVVWSAEKGNHGVAAIGQRFLLCRQRLRWLPRKQVPQSRRQVGEVPCGRHGAKLKMDRTFPHPVC